MLKKTVNDKYFEATSFLKQCRGLLNALLLKLPFHTVNIWHPSFLLYTCYFYLKMKDARYLYHSVHILHHFFGTRTK